MADKKVLFINACVRKGSRTKRIADSLLQKLAEPVNEVILSEIDFPVADEDFLKRRDELIAKGDLEDPMFNLARQFSEADKIVIAAPFWDLSFPAALKQYFEQINVVGITFYYTDEGMPKGLCKATELYYVTTAGGEFFPEGHGFGYVKSLAQNFYGIQNVRLIKLTGLDIIGADTEKMIQEAISSIDQFFQKE